MTSRALASASLRIFSALSRASARRLSADCCATMRTWEIWRSEAVMVSTGVGAGATGAATVAALRCSSRVAI